MTMNWSKNKFWIIVLVLVAGIVVAVYYYRKKKKDEAGGGTGTGGDPVGGTSGNQTDSTAGAIAKAYSYGKK